MMRKEQMPLFIKAAGLLMMAAGVLCGSGTLKRAHAQWQIRSEGQGTKSQQAGGANPINGKWTPNGLPSTTYDASVTSSGSAGQNIKASTTGTVTLICTWTGPVQSLPKMLPLKITSSAGGGITWAPTPLTQPSFVVTANNGFKNLSNPNGPGTVLGEYYVTFMTNGQTTFRIPVSLSSSGVTTAPSGVYYVIITMSAGASALIAPRGVAITSDIDQSYYKSPTAPTPVPRPTVGAGTPTPRPQPTQAPVQFSDPPAWKLPVQPKADGSMTVESAATLSLGVDANLLATPYWYGGGVFTANTAGFTSPSYSWDVGSNNGVYNGNPLTLVDYPQYVLGGPKTLTLGTGIPLPITSTSFAVKVTDSVGSLSNAYTVNWHETLENISIDGAPLTNYGELPAVVTNDSSASVDPNGTIKVWVRPRFLKATVLLSPTESVFVAAGSNLAGLILGGPLTWVAKWGQAAEITYGAAALAMAKVGYKVYKSEQTVQNETIVLKNTPEEWQRAVDSTQRNLAGDTTADVRVEPADVASTTLQNLAYVNSTMRARVNSATTWKPFKADFYDKHGYNGIVPGHFEEEKIEVVGVYTYNGAPLTR